jgi:hypothetical protein
MTLMTGAQRAFDVEDVDLFDLAGTLRLDRVQSVALLERARDPRRSAAPAFPISTLPCGATPVLELRRPVHLLADLLTMVEEARRPLDRISVCYVGDGQADIGRSVLLAGALLGMDVRISSPAPMWPADDLIAQAQDLAAESGARLLITPHRGHALREARFVVVGAWAHGDLAPVGGPLPGYLITEDFLATSGLRAHRPAAAGAVDFAPDVPRTLQPIQLANRRRVMTAVLADWMRA